MKHGLLIIKSSFWECLYISKIFSKRKVFLHIMRTSSEAHFLPVRVVYNQNVFVVKKKGFLGGTICKRALVCLQYLIR